MKTLSKETFIELVLLQKFPQLEDEQKRFLELIHERGVCITVPREKKNSPQVKELLNALSDLRKKGFIPSLEITEA